MASDLLSLLAPQCVMDLITRIRPGHGPLSSWFGFTPETFNENSVEISGANTLRGQGSVRNYTYRIFDRTRVPMKARAPGTGPATVSQNPMGQNTVSIARWHQKISLNYEFLGNLSPMIGPNSQIDEGGKSYIAQQTMFLAEQGSNAVEMMAAGLLRDSLYFYQQGDNWLPTFTAPVAPTVGFQVSFSIPAGNKNQLNMTGAGNILTIPWDNSAAPILHNTQSIVAAYSQLNRYRMEDIWINSTQMMNVLLNTEVRNTAGSSQMPFAQWDEVKADNLASGPANHQTMTLRGLPMVKWNVCNDTLALNTDVDPSYGTAPSTATLAKEIPDNMAIFAAKPSKEWVTMYLGGEHVIENPGMPAALRMGWYFWHEFVTQPACVELLALLNAVPALYVPSAIAPATITGF